MPVLTPLTANGTYIVPADEPAFYTPEQMDKLAIGATVIGWPLLTGGVILITNSCYRKWTWWSFARLSSLWMWSSAISGYGIFAQWGRFSHVTDFITIVHVQSEWLIIGLLLGLGSVQTYALASFVGFVLYFFMATLPGIKGAYFTTTLIGGFGDVFVPVLLFYGKQYVLALGGIAHTANAFVGFVGFVQYTSLSLYIGLQVLFATVHAAATITGIFYPGSFTFNDNIRLEGDDTTIESLRGNPGINPLEGVTITKPTLIKLVLISFGVSFVAFLYYNFWPRH